MWETKLRRWEKLALRVKQVENLFDIDAVLSGGLKEWHAQLIGELPSTRSRHDTLILEVALVTHQNHLQDHKRIQAYEQIA